MREVIAARVRRTKLAAALVVAVALSDAAGAETIVVTMDQAKLARVPPRTATLVVGNPLIADVSVQTGGFMVITGKGYGVTNVIALDTNGLRLYEKQVRVQGPAEDVVVYRGNTRESYICKPNCERRITLGDAPEFFDPTLNQSAARNGRAMSSQSSAPGGR
jgi:Pilus formation protein N terminal region